MPGCELTCGKVLLKRRGAAMNMVSSQQVQVNGQRTYTSELVEPQLLGETVRLDQWQERGCPATRSILV